MSRRVFDVGLGRMHNTLKSQKQHKRSSSAKDDTTKSGAKSFDWPEQQQLAMVPQLKRAKSKSLSEAQGVNGSPGETNEGENLQDLRYRSESPHDYDLKPPPPNIKVKQIDILSEKLLSGDHLDIILNDPSFFLRFTAFLNRYRPNLAPTMIQYLETQKAMKAVAYANALSKSLHKPSEESNRPGPAASLEPGFKHWVEETFNTLVEEALPAYVTSCLTKVVTEYVVKEITGEGSPLHRELVGGLGEVFCLADPSIEDCPIVYASEEFYRTTRYSRDDSLGKNCRFLQGTRSDKATIARLSRNIKAGQETCETILNYRRDGSPFMNLLLIAPLYDNRGTVKYHIGAQVDVSGLVENGRGLDSFERLLNKRPPGRKAKTNNGDDRPDHLKCLEDLSQMLSVDESSLLQGHSHGSSVNENASSYSYSVRGTPRKQDESTPRRRKMLGNEVEGDEGDKLGLSALSSSLPSGRLPGVYQNYLLVRPHPSLRILFVSPSLRVPGLLQSPFIDHIAGPPHVVAGLIEAFEQGAAVTAKVNWISNTKSGRPQSSSREPEARTRYISCTPLLGSDDNVGVWMVVMVENETVSGSLRRPGTADRQMNDGLTNGVGSQHKRDGIVAEENMYADYMRHSAAASEDSGKRKPEVNGDGQENAASLKGPVNGLKDEERVQEVFTPSVEKGSMI